ncbi:MAG: hypothetical protein M5U13_16435 [Thermoanaerobaculia bacterium]|nr:hypothetical protein [Thermoanaerobaculia bacterium]
MITFPDRLDELQGNLELVESMWGVWSELNAAACEAPKRAALDGFGSFFLSTMEACLLATCVGLWRLYDKRPDVLAIPTLAGEALAEPLAATSTPPDVSDLTGMAAPLVKKVKHLRHKLFAHRDRRLSSTQVFIRAQLTPDDVCKLITLSRDILNAYSGWFRKQFDAASDHAATDTRRLVQLLVDA